MMKFTVSPLLWKTTSDQPNCFKISINFFYFYIKTIFFTLTSSQYFLGSEMFCSPISKTDTEKYIDKHEMNSCKMETKSPN